jgi:DNA invertase Pin-like site-specific DNA recombinase
MEKNTYVLPGDGKNGHFIGIQKPWQRIRRLAKLEDLRLHDLRHGFASIAADMPDANTLTIGVMASLAQHERETISNRTKAALEAARARGTKLGGRRHGAPDIRLHHAAGNGAKAAKAKARAELLREEIEPLRLAGLSLNAIAAKLNADGSLTPRGKVGSWMPTAVKRVIERF